MDKTICELFAGVGGFRLGMERLNTDWKTVWFSQWEPDKQKQWAHACYVKHFGDCPDMNGEYHTNDDINTVKKETIPDHTLLMISSPCQDYSIAHTKSTSYGIEDKKGVLWWQARDVIAVKQPKFVIFENVDRLLKSPAKQRGRDFGIILKCFADLDYTVEWRVVNSAKYGAAQRRKRLFLFAYRNDTVYGKEHWTMTPTDIISFGFMNKSFEAGTVTAISEVKLADDIFDVQDTFSYNFENAGFMRNGIVYSCKVDEDLTRHGDKKNETITTLGDILQHNVDSTYFITEEKLEKWKYLKGAKKFNRTSKDGHSYIYSEGAIPYPDSNANPSRTLLTSEGSINRCSHVVEDLDTHKYRILTPIETERLQGFDDDWTKETTIGEMSNRMRYFCMGNSLVVSMITRMGKTLDKIMEYEK